MDTAKTTCPILTMVLFGGPMAINVQYKAAISVQYGYQMSCNGDGQISPNLSRAMHLPATASCYRPSLYLSLRSWICNTMEESGEQCTIVFALIVSGRDRNLPPLHPLAGFATINAKTTVHCSPDFSMCNTIGKGSQYACFTWRVGGGGGWN